MKILFERGWANLDDAQLQDLVRIVHSIADGWHSLLGPEPPQYPEQGLDLRATELELLSKSWAASNAWEDGADASLVIVSDDDDPDLSARPRRLHLSVAAQYLTRALEIIVENATNDGDFLLSHLSVVDPDLTDMLSWARPPYLFVQGGGKEETEREVERKAPWYETRGLPKRFMVVVDSDRRFPGHVVATTGRLVQTCEDHGVTVRVLEKRSIENYLSDDFLEKYAALYPDKADHVRFVLGLSRAQRDHFHIKSGVRLTVGGPEADLYDGLDSGDLALAKLPRAMEHFLLDPQASESEMRTRGSLDEFKALSASIRSEI